ncbi:hypothetical protein XELAEV_18025540mg [Xenopus laevis]|uniref:Uncharacterized protein n=1 Tax=Xenopus laevis TaxID=8355 RepID=A0A974CZQ6_XENLA|nr:hypothetical protein XELAEV_18025540mg [Xenopus laevis]
MGEVQHCRTGIHGTPMKLRSGMKFWGRCHCAHSPCFHPSFSLQAALASPRILQIRFVSPALGCSLPLAGTQRVCHVSPAGFLSLVLGELLVWPQPDSCARQGSGSFKGWG